MFDAILPSSCQENDDFYWFLIFVREVSLYDEGINEKLLLDMAVGENFKSIVIDDVILTNSSLLNAEITFCSVLQKKDL
jgi:hypothetical protein